MELRNNSRIILIGAGIMSATLAVLLKEICPNANIKIFERLPHEAEESSDAWNNAGTGHSAFCELNYTPQMDDGRIDISKAIKIAASYEESRQLWASLIERGSLKNAADFIHSIPHISFVWGSENVEYLRKRHALLSAHPLFEGMEFTEDDGVLISWMPLVMQGRSGQQPLAATRMQKGTDVDFGKLTEELIACIGAQSGATVAMNSEVKDIKNRKSGRWAIEVKDISTGKKHYHVADFVFIGAGGGTLPLLEKSDIPEAQGYGGFPISGQWLKCNNETVIAQHHAKVYGKASVGAPPMSVPHLDTRVIEGKQHLFFGPYAGFSTKFLKNGSYWDLFLSIESDNIFPMLSAGWKNLPLTKYLVQQVVQSDEERLDALKEYFPKAKKQDWELAVAGQRVQVIKKDKDGNGTLEFGTEVVCSADGSIAGLLGASPGASTAVNIMLDTLQKCFPAQMQSTDWQNKLNALVPVRAKSFITNPSLVSDSREHTAKVLGLEG